MYIQDSSIHMHEVWRYNDTPQIYIDGLSLYNVAFRGNNEETTVYIPHPLLHNPASAGGIRTLILSLVILTGNYRTQEEDNNSRKLLFTFTHLHSYAKQVSTNPGSSAYGIFLSFHLQTLQSPINNSIRNISAGINPATNTFFLIIYKKKQDFVVGFITCSYKFVKQELQTMDKDYYKERIRLAICYIENNLDHKIKLSDIADAAMISEYYFHRLFKKETGHTPKDYTKQRQMQEAYKTLSTNRQIEIQDIWIQLGYTSSSHFAKDFREYFGCNPSELKRNADHAKKQSSGL